MQDFISRSKEIEQEQQKWVQISQKINDSFLKAKAENSALRSRAKKLGLLNEEGRGFSELSQDLKHQGI